MFAFTAAAGARTGGCYAACVTPAEKQEARRAITRTFHRYARQALAVAQCESGMSVRAYNGIYLGLFQVSSHWRRTVPGWSYSNPWAQARHAYRVFKLTGSDWSPWECKPG